MFYLRERTSKPCLDPVSPLQKGWTCSFYSDKAYGPYDIRQTSFKRSEEFQADNVYGSSCLRTIQFLQL